MPLNLHHLKYFLDTVNHGSLARSATLNRVSPSAVSQAIRELEKRLGQELVHHRRNQLELTDAGRKLAQRGPRVFDELSELEQALRTDESSSPTGPLTFGISHGVAVSLLPGFLRKFTSTYDGIRLTLKTGPTAQLKEQIQREETELGVFVDDGQLQAFDKECLLSGRFIAVTSRNASRNRVPGKFLVSEVRPDISRILDLYQKKHGREPGILLQVEGWEIIANLAAEGVGIGLIPDFFLRGPLKSRLRQLELGLPRVGYDLCLVRKKGRRASRNSLLFAKELRQKLSGGSAFSR